MGHEDFVYDLIKLLKSWGAWNRDVKIYCNSKFYSPCKWPQGESGKCGFDDYERRKVFYDADKVRNTFRDINDVVISVIDAEDMMYDSETCHEDWIGYIDLNTALNDLFVWGYLEVEIADLPMSKKIDAFNNREDLQKGFYEEFDREEVKEYPGDFGFPSEIEFDSADEYKAFIEEEIEQEKIKYISGMHGNIRYGNELAEEIDNLLDKYDLKYLWLDGRMAFKKKDSY